MAQVAPDLADVAAKLLQAEKRGFAKSQAKFQADCEAREAKFNAELEALAPQKPKEPARSEFADNWSLARKSWAWLYGDSRLLKIAKSLYTRSGEVRFRE